MLIAMRMFSTGLGFVYWALAARLAPVEQVGLATGIISSAILLAELAQLGVGYALVRYLGTDSRPRRLIGLAVAIPGIGSLMLAGLFMATVQVWTPDLLVLRSNSTYGLLYIVLTVAWALSVGLHWVFVATRQAVYSLVRQTSHMVLAVLLFVAFSRLLRGVLPFVASHAAAATLSVALSAALFLVKGRSQPLQRSTAGRQKTATRSLGRYALASYATGQVYHVPNMLLPILVLSQLGAEQAAYFFVVWTIAGAVPSWISAMGDSLFAEGANSPAEAGSYAKKSGLLSAGLVSIIVVFLMLAGRHILQIYGPDYAEHGLPAFRLAALTALPSVLLSVFVSYLRVRDRLKAVFALSISDSLLRLVMVVVGVTQMGLQGGAIGWLISSLLVLGAAVAWWYWQERASHAAPAAIPRQAGEGDRVPH